MPYGQQKRSRSQFRRRSKQQQARAALTMCIIGSAAVHGLADGAESVPVLLRTTNPVRVSTPLAQSSVSVPFSMPSVSLRDQAAETLNATPSLESTESSTQNTTLGYDRATKQIRSLGLGRTRVNRFVGFRTGSSADKHSELASNTNSSATSPSSWAAGEIQSNPLVVDAIPTLRRFSPDEPARQSVSVSSQTLRDIESETGLRIARDSPLAVRNPDELDNTIDALSLDSSGSTGTALSETARDSGFGMLAIDQIGGHLSRTDGFMPEADTVIAKRFPNDSIAGRKPLPYDFAGDDRDAASSASEGSLRGQLNRLESNRFAAEELPQLPPPKQSAITVSNMVRPPTTNASQSVNRRDETVFDPLPSPYRPSPEGPVPREVEDLISSANRIGNLPEIADEALPEKPSIADRFSSWAKRIKGGSKSKNTSDATRKTQGSSSPTPTVKSKAKPTRSPGLFNRLFKK